MAFIGVKDLTGEGIASTLLQFMSQFNLSLEKLRGHGYDGASSMSGRYEGVQAHISRLGPLVVYSHTSQATASISLSVNRVTFQ